MKKYIILILVILFASICLYKINTFYSKYYNIYKGQNLCDNTKFYSEHQEFCLEVETVIKNYEHPTEDTNTVVFNMLNTSKLFNDTIYFMPLVIMLFSLNAIHKYIKNNYFKYSSSRENYKTFLKKLFVKSYRYAYIYPLFILFIYICAFCISGHFDIKWANVPAYYTYETVYLKMGPFLLIYLTIYVLLYSLFYINLSNICAKLNKSTTIALIESYIIFIGSNIIIELIAYFLASQKLIGATMFNYLNILSIHFLYNAGSPFIVLLKPLILFSLSFIIMLIVYKNKEKSVIGWEK